MKLLTMVRYCDVYSARSELSFAFSISMANLAGLARWSQVPQRPNKVADQFGGRGLVIPQSTLSMHT